VSVFFLLIIGILYLQSPLSHIQTIKVNGNIHVSDEEVVTLSSVTNRTSFWNIDNDKIMNNIKKNKQIKDVSIKREFPNTVIISVEEMKRVAYAINDGHYLPILEDGSVLKSSEGSTFPSDAPILLNWESGNELEEMSAELAKLSPAIVNSISEIHHTPQDSDPLHITLFMNDGHEVSATIDGFAKKMSAYPSIVSQIGEDLNGVIHMEVAYYFESYEKVEEQTEEEEEVTEDESEG
jgi:cell division protein FtsQ